LAGEREESSVEPLLIADLLRGGNRISLSFPVLKIVADFSPQDVKGKKGLPPVSIFRQSFPE